MPKNAAIKNAARARQAETGESYAEALAAVAADHDKPVCIEVWVPEMRIGGDGLFVLDTHEARQAWRKLDTTDSDAVERFAREYLGDDLLSIAARELDPRTSMSDVWSSITLAEEPGDLLDPNAVQDAAWVSKRAGRTVTPGQVAYLVDHYGIPDSEQFDGGPDLDMVVKVLDSLPADRSTTALLERYAEALAGVDLAEMQPEWLPMNMVIDPSRWLLRDAINGGFTDDTPLAGYPTRWPDEVHQIRVIIDCATEARDTIVLHQCIDIIAAWMHKLADHAAGGPAVSHRLADGRWTS